jgi:uncharacterized protein
MPFSDVELRVLGALVEKERTTPDAYPLSPQALLTACNQRTSREPVTDYHLQEVQEAAFRLRERGFVATVQEVSDRVPKHRHQLARVWDVAPLELSLLAVLMLRGEQTPGELRARIERYGVPNDAAAVEAALRRLAERGSPLVENLGRRPGQSQDRWRHTLPRPAVRRERDPEAAVRPRVRCPPSRYSAGECRARPSASAPGQSPGARPGTRPPITWPAAVARSTSVGRKDGAMNLSPVPRSPARHTRCGGLP